MKEVVLLIPSLDPNEKLIRTVESMIDAGFSRVLLVNDGSNKKNLWPFEELAKHDEVEVIGYEQNHGKGHALKYGYKYILENYDNFAGVITADGDGQHLAKDCIKTAEKMLKLDECVFGCRNFNDPTVPKRNKMGNKISIFMYNYLCGIKISDTQTGLRAVPYKYLKEFSEIEGERFEYETNVLIYMKAHGMSFNEQAITTVYEDDSNQGSHFNVITDSIKVYKPILKFGGPKFLKFCLSSGITTIIEAGLFALLDWFIGNLIVKNTIHLPEIIGSVFIATFISRMVSSIVNYIFNKNIVFNKDGAKAKTCIKYFILVICQLSVSAGIVSLISILLGVSSVTWHTIIKLLVDGVLFFFSFKIQREWVFK